MEHRFLQSAVGAIKSGLWKAQEPTKAAAVTIHAGKIVIDPTSSADFPKVLYSVTNDGLAVVSIEGPMMKMDSKFGGANTMRARRALRSLAADPDVIGAMMYFDTPGGHVAGTLELANEITATRKFKTVHGHADDLIASAGMWVGSACERLSINAIGEAGSIGVVGVIEDWSKAYEAAGVTVHILSTGAFKGAFTPGTTVTPEQLAYLQKTVDDINQFFLDAVQKGRGINAKKLAEIADGRVFIASEAKALGLVDEVESFDQSMAILKKSATQKQAQIKQSARAKNAVARLELEAIE